MAPKHKFSVSALSIMLALSMALAFSPGASAAPSWSQIPGALTGSNADALAYDSVHNILYVGSGQGVYRCKRPYTSPTWTKISAAADVGSYSIIDLAYDSSRNLLYALTYDGAAINPAGAWRCANPSGSPTWSNLNGTGIMFDQCSYDPDHNILYIASHSDGAFRVKNPDSGAPVWTGNGRTGYTVLYDRTNSRVYIGLNGGGVGRVDNPDVNFGAFTVIGPSPGSHINYSLALNPAGTRLYASFYDPMTPAPEGVWRCVNPGTAPSWTKISSGGDVGNDVMEDLAYDGSANVLYGGNSSHKGVWRCANPGGSTPTWTQTGGGLATDRMQCLELAGTRGVLFAGAMDHGAWFYSEPTRAVWYLPEGTTAWGFDSYISIQNPNPVQVTAEMTYMTDTGPVNGPDVVLPAASQATVFPEAVLGERDFSTRVECPQGYNLAVDRTMTWTGPGAASPEAHNSVGVTSPANAWYLPEGSATSRQVV